MNISIRGANEQDFQAVYQLNKFGLGYDFDNTRQRLRHILELQNNKIFVALIDDKVVGYAHAADYDCTYSEPVKNILAIVVAAEKRSLGIGRLLIGAIEDWAKSDGAVGVRLVSGMEREQAHKFYLACGYSQRKTQKNFVKIFG